MVHHERLNATFRSHLAVLARRTRALLRGPHPLEPLMCLMGCVDNFCTYHCSLRVPGLIGGHRWVPRTPAIAAGITDHCWTVQGARHAVPLSAGCRSLRGHLLFTENDARLWKKP